MKLTAEQKLRETITGIPVGNPDYLHEGPDVVRWLKGGTLPPAWVTFHQDGDRLEVRCAGCKNILGSIPSDYESEAMARELGRIRLLGHETHQPVDWPGCNIR